MRSRPIPPGATRAGVAAVGFLLVACGGGQTGSTESGRAVAGEVVVFAAASLSAVFTELGERFTETHPGTTVRFNFAGSTRLASQIVEGAPADVFASADTATMAELGGHAVGDDPVVFATNQSTIVVAPGNPLGIAGIEDVADDDLILVTCSPAVPCGSYAAQIFANAGIDPTPDSYEENVNGVIAKVSLGEADVGIAYVSDVVAADGRVDGVGIPAELNVVAEYPIVPTTNAPNPEGGRAFVEFVLSDEGQDVLTAAGFSPP